MKVRIATLPRAQVNALLKGVEQKLDVDGDDIPVVLQASASGKRICLGETVDVSDEDGAALVAMGQCVAVAGRPKGKAKTPATDVTRYEGDTKGETLQ